MAALGLFLPFYLWLGGGLIWKIPLQNSISAYYHASGGELRDEFVGTLIAVAVLMVAYRGYSRCENVVLDFAGAFLVAVALIPKDWPLIPEGPLTWLHGPSAIIFFLLVAYIAVCRSWDTLTVMESGRLRRFFEGLYQLLGLLMVALPGMVLFFTLRAGPEPFSGHTVFWLEAGGIWSFGVFWTTKTIELYITKYEEKVFDGNLRLAEIEGCRFCPPFCGWLKVRDPES